MTSVGDAKQRALDARIKMLAVRPGATEPLPDGFAATRMPCGHFFETAAVLFAQAAAAYGQGDPVIGQIYEAWAQQSVMLGQACEAVTS
jgi:hypothetical protein